MSDPSTPPPAPTVTLSTAPGAAPVTLVEPPMLFTMTGYKRDADGQADAAAMLAYGAAALRMCWPDNAAWPTKPRPREWYPGVDVIRYGGEVYQALRSATRGSISVFALHDALREAEAWAIRSALTADELEESKRFLAEAEGSSETSSDSAESTDSAPGGGTG